MRQAWIARDSGLLEIKKYLETKGVDVFYQPVLDIAFIEPQLSFDVDVILITSANAAHYLKKQKKSILKNTKIICVGQSTASLLKDDFGCVFNVNGNAKSLLEFVLNTISVREKILYLRAREVSLDLTSYLKNEGFDATEEIVYVTDLKENLDDVFLEKIKNNLSFIFLLSQKTAQAFLSLTANVDKNLFSNTLFFCLSEEIANVLIEKDIYQSSQIVFSKEPNSVSLLDELKKYI